MVDETGFIRVVLADDHTVVRKGIRDFLEEESDNQVVAERRPGPKQSPDWRKRARCPNNYLRLDNGSNGLV